MPILISAIRPRMRRGGLGSISSSVLFGVLLHATHANLAPCRRHRCRFCLLYASFRKPVLHGQQSMMGRLNSHSPTRKGCIRPRSSLIPIQLGILYYGGTVVHLPTAWRRRTSTFGSRNPHCNPVPECSALRQPATDAHTRGLRHE